MVGACEVETVCTAVCSSSVIWPCICRKTDLNRYLVHRYDNQKLAHIQL